MITGTQTDQKPGESKDTQWDRIAESRQFKDLLAVKKAFMVPAFIVFLVYFFALAVLVGYAPRLAATRVIGTVNVAYLFVLSEFAVGWVIAALYLMAASRFDALTRDLLSETTKRRGQD